MKGIQPFGVFHAAPARMRFYSHLSRREKMAMYAHGSKKKKKKVGGGLNDVEGLAPFNSTISS